MTSSATPNLRPAGSAGPVEVGDLFRTGNGTTYEVIGLRGLDPAFPVELVPVDFAGVALQEITQKWDDRMKAKGVSLADYIAFHKRFLMRQELRWFDRSDVVRVQREGEAA